jgi:RNA recognition motif-containing protein
MERSTGKTMRCFVEFEDHKSAQATVDHLNASCDPHVGPRMANRHVDVSISSQKELMEALFPMAKCLVWANDRFVSRGTRPDEWWSAGFNGFLTDEELFCVLRHAKEPHRVSGIAPISNSSKLTNTRERICRQGTSAGLRIDHKHSMEGKSLPIIRQTCFAARRILISCLVPMVRGEYVHSPCSQTPV